MMSTVLNPSEINCLVDASVSRMVRPHNVDALTAYEIFKIDVTVAFSHIPWKSQMILEELTFDEFFDLFIKYSSQRYEYNKSCNLGI